MNPKIARFVIALAIVIMSQLVAGCKHVDVNLGNNGCGVVACTNKPNQTSITIH